MKKITALIAIIGILTMASCGGDTDATSSTGTSSVSGSSSVSSSTDPVSSEVSVEDRSEITAYGEELEDLLGDTANLMENYFENYSAISVTQGFNWDGTDRPELGQEVAPNLFDGDTATKWCCGDGDVAGNSAVVWSMNQQVTVTHYTFTTANDNAEFAGRNPIGWRLYATNSELTDVMAMTEGMFGAGTVPEGWVLLDAVAETEMPDGNFTECGWAIDQDSQGAYTHYMLLIDSCDSANEVFQMSEIDLYGSAE